MPEYSQENRIIAVQTPLGDNVLLLERLSGHEAMSRLFTFYLDMLSESPGISFTDIVGKRVTITIHTASDQNRYVNGFVSKFEQSGRDQRFTHYKCEVVPWLWFLTRNANCRIFQNKTIPQIVTQVFRDLGLTDFKDKTTGSYDPPREYVVQYRETDFNFVSRLMEQYGIFYYFEHELSKHTLVMADAPSSCQPCPFQPSAIFDSTGRILQEERITSFQIGQEMRSGAFAMNDYNFETPLTDLDVSDPTVDPVANNATFSIYDYPGIYLTKGAGEGVAKVRMQEEEVGHLVAQGVSNCAAFLPGYRFDLQQHYRKDLNQSYVLAETQHFANCGASYYSGQSDEAETYTNHFSCIPFSVPFRPVRVTPRPFVQGPQTAVVVGPKGEEIYVDKYGRVKVQFFWDREGKADENSSCWIRVSQYWAGKHWGAMWIPRIGQEVIVDFLEGDPDRPIITGRVYNADQMPPYPLPAEMTKSTVKSYSTKGGGGFNEIRFEDKKGKEQVFIFAQRNKDVRVQADRMVSIGGDTHLTVGGPKGGGNQFEKLFKDKHLRVKGDRNTSIEGDESLSIFGDEKVVVNGDYGHHAFGDIYLLADGNMVIESSVNLTLKVGGNFININPGGIYINGNMVYINSGGSAGSGKKPNPKDPTDPNPADTADPGQASGPPIDFIAKKTVVPPSSYSPAALVLKAAALSGAPFCDT